MSEQEKAASHLYEVIVDLVSARPECAHDAAALAERINRARLLLTGQDGEWVSVAEAQRLLGAQCESDVRTYLDLGLLRTRELPDGCTQVRLDDLLYRRRKREALTEVGGDDLTAEELRILREARPGKNPWEREAAQQAR